MDCCFASCHREASPSAAHCGGGRHQTLPPHAALEAVPPHGNLTTRADVTPALIQESFMKLSKQELDAVIAAIKP